MSVFDELVEELKQENLLEETVWDATRANENPGAFTVPPTVPLATKPTVSSDDFSVQEPTSKALKTEPADTAKNQEFFRKRAMDEVASLQMVEHVFTGVEREHMKIAARPFDDLEVKKALHRFIQVSNSGEVNEIPGAESAVYSETNTWFDALARRDGNITIANLRRFCETSRPVLSSQALVALGRFYRNSTFSESVRAKFDFIMTRLFSRDLGDEKRKLLFGKSEAVGHIHSLYATWESLSLFSAEEHRDEVVAAKSKFEEIYREAETAESFDSLVASDFFNRVRLHKEEIGELFFETNVLAAALECNIRVGNRFVDLLRKEAEAADIGSLEEKYGGSFDSLASAAASRSIDLVEVARGETSDEGLGAVEDATTAERPAKGVSVNFERAPVEDGTFRLFAVNKWVLIACVLILAITAGVYFLPDSSESSRSSVEVAPALDIASSELSSHLLEASHTSETLYAVTKPTWDALSEEQQKDFLSKVFAFAESKKLKRVNLINGRGKTVGTASTKSQQVVRP